MNAQQAAAVRTFDIHDADWVCLLDEQKSPAESVANRRVDYLKMIHRASLLTDPPDQLSVIGVSFDPGFYVATHYHDVDQYLFIVAGEFRMGNRRLHPGHMAYMPAGNPYNAQVGRAGGTFLEFREKPFYRTAFTERDAPKVGPGTPTRIDGWPKPEPKKGRTEFLDLESHPAGVYPGLGPGDRGGPVPQALAGKLRCQALHVSPGYSMHTVLIDADTEIPSHSQDADKILMVLNGALRLDGGQANEYRPGAGVFVPAHAPVRMRSGAAGARYLEFRKQPTWRTQWSN